MYCTILCIFSLLIVTIKCLHNFTDIPLFDEALEFEYATDKLGLWRMFADGNYSHCMNFTLRIDRMLNAVANVDIGAMEQFIEMDEHSLKTLDQFGYKSAQTLSSLYDNAPGWGGETPLTILARISLPRSSIMMQILSSKGLNFAKSQINGYTPLILAIIYKNFGAVKVLLELAERKKYALHMKKTEIIEKETQKSLINTIVERTDVINEVDSMGRTALFYAVLMEDENLVASLLYAGAEPNLADFSGVTPLLLASKNNILVIVKLLLNKGADQTVLDSKKRDALSVAIQNNHPDVIAALLEDPTFPSKYLTAYPSSKYKSHISRPPYHVQRLLEIFTILQLKEENIRTLFRIEFARNDTSLCDLRDDEGRTIVNIAITREMYGLLEEVLEFYRNSSLYKYEGYTSCNPHILDKSSRGPVDYLLAGTLSNKVSKFSMSNEPYRIFRRLNTESVNNDLLSQISSDFNTELQNSNTITFITDRRQLLLEKFLKLSNPLDLSSYLFELLRRRGNPTISTIKAMIDCLGTSRSLLLHITSRDGHNALTFALATGQLTVAKEILDILINSRHSNKNSYKSALKLAISYSAGTRTTSVISEVALRKPMIIHEWICERRLTSIIEVEELKFVLLNLPRDFVGFSKHPNLCKPLYSIVKQILDPDSQIESVDIVAVMLDTNGGLPFLDPKDVSMALNSVGTSLGISASFGLNLFPCLEWTSTMSYALAPYYDQTMNDTNIEKSTNCTRYLSNKGKIIVKHGLGSTIASILTDQGIIGANNGMKRNQILDLVFSCPLREVDPVLKNFQKNVLIITSIMLFLWILATSFVIVFSSRSRLDIFRFVPQLQNSETEKLTFTLAEWKIYKLVSVLRFISLLYCIILLTTIGRVRHVLYTVFFLFLEAMLKLNQFLTLKENDVADIATAFIREELSDKDNNALNKDLEDNDDVNENNIVLNNSDILNKNEEARHEAIHYGTFGEEFNARHSYTTLTDSRNTFQNDIVNKEHITAEQYAKITLFIGICAFLIAIAANMQRYIFGNFREFYRFNESYYFVINHTYVAISTEVVLIINTWSLAFAILRAPGLIIFILKQRIQVVKYFLLAYPDINQNIFNTLKRTQIGTFSQEQSPNASPSANFSSQFSKGTVFIPPGRFDIVLCQWVRVRHAIMKRMHKRFTVASKPYNNLYFIIGFIVVVLMFKNPNFSLTEQNLSNELFHYMLFDEFGFTLLAIFAAYCITLLVIVWFSCTSNHITEMLHWRLFWDAFSFMPPCSAQQIVLQHIKLTQDLDNEDRRVSLWSIPITNIIKNTLLFIIIILWVYITIVGISHTFI